MKQNYACLSRKEEQKQEAGIRRAHSPSEPLTQRVYASDHWAPSTRRGAGNPAGSKSHPNLSLLGGGF